MACEGGIYAVGGWHLNSLVSPDSNTALYTAVERYDPWDDAWRFASRPSFAVLYFVDIFCVCDVYASKIDLTFS